MFYFIYSEELVVGFKSTKRSGEPMDFALARAGRATALLQRRKDIQLLFWDDLVFPVIILIACSLGAFRRGAEWPMIPSLG